MPDRINQHWVPRVHLRGFASAATPGLLWTYDKLYPDTVKQRSIDKQICCAPHYYDQIRSDGTTTDTFEEALGKIETEAGKIIKGLREKHTLSPEGKGRLALYIALLLTRGPAFRDGCGAGLKKRIETVAQRLKPAPPMPPELVCDLETGGGIVANMRPHATIYPLVTIALQISEAFCRKKWDFFASTASHFVTTDTPTIFGPGRGRTSPFGPAHPEGIAYCPLRNDMLLAIRPLCSLDADAYEFRNASDELVAKVNQLMCCAAQRYVYAGARSNELRQLVRNGMGLQQTYVADSKTGDARWGMVTTQETL
jgi:hypothetical protein